MCKDRPIAIVMFSVAMKGTQEKQFQGRRDLVWLTVSGFSVHSRPAEGEHHNHKEHM